MSVFDLEGFYAAIDETRVKRGLTWREAGHEAGVAPSLFTRMANGHRPDLTSFGRLLTWSGLSADLFFDRDEPDAPDPMVQIRAVLRADPQLDPLAAAALGSVIHANYEVLTHWLRQSAEKI